MSDESQQKLNLLVAYPYLKPEVVKLIQEHQQDIRFVLDSGAFTAWKAGKPIKLDDYCRFIESLPFKPWRYFTLDVIGDAHGTMKNYETMLSRGFNPVPIFTRGEDPSYLETYYKTSDLVGVGGLVGTERNKGFVKGIMKAVRGRKVHWLGFTNLAFVKHFRPYMCDSSSWEGGARFGSVTVYLGGGHRMTIKKGEVVGRPVPSSFANAVQRLGFDPNDLRDVKNWHGGASISRRLGAASYIKLSLEVQKKLGTKLFLALASDYMPVLLDCYYRLKEKEPV